MMGIAVCGKDEKVGTDTRCRAVVRAPDRGARKRRRCGATRRSVTDVARSAGAKMRVGKFVHFSGNASPPCGGKVTRDRQDTCGARGRQLPSVRSRVSSVPFRSRPEMPTTRFIRTLPLPSDFPAAFTLPSALLLSQFSATEPGPKVANAGITWRKPQLRRFERLTAMRAISDGYLQVVLKDERAVKMPKKYWPKISRDPLIIKFLILNYFYRLH